VADVVVVNNRTARVVAAAFRESILEELEVDVRVW
jgi:hypothetical protein